MRYAFGAFQLDEQRECVLGPDGVVVLRPQTYAVLRLLVARAPALVPHEEILASVWGHSAISDSAVAQTIKELRQAFGDSARAPRYIETRQRRGYRLAAEVRRLDDAAAQPGPAAAGGAAAPDAPRTRLRRAHPVLLGAAAVLLALLLAWRGLSGQDPAAAHLPPPADPVAARNYADGTRALQRLDARTAIAALRQAAGHAPEHVGVALALAQAQELAGDAAAAQAIADRLARHSDAWPKAVQLRLTALSARLRHRWREAEAALLALHTFHPEPGTALQLIEAQLAAGHADQAARTLATLEDRERSEPRAALAAAYVAHAQHDYGAQRDAARAAADWALRDGAVALAARAGVVGALAELRDGDLLRAAELARAALEQAAEAGDPRTQGDALLVLASAALQRAELDAAGDHVAAAREAFARVGHGAGAAECERTLGLIAEQRGELGEALAAYRRASSILERAGDHAGAARVQSAIGTAEMRAGNAEAALAAFDRARAAYAEVDDRRGLAGTWNNRGMLLARMGRRDEAQSAFDRALEAFEDIADRRGQATTLGNLAALAGRAGQSARAIALNQRALAIFTAIGAEADAARLAFNLGLAEQRRGALGEALAMMERAVEGFSRLGTASHEAAARTALGELQRRMGRLEAAAAALAQAQALEVEDPLRLASSATLAGRIAQAEQRPDEARAAFERARKLRADAGATLWVQATDLDLAGLALAQGRLAEAEQSARALARAFEESGEYTDQAAALHLLAESLLRQSRPDAARQALTAASAALARAPDAELVLRIALLEAQLATGPVASERLAWVQRTAAEQGFHPLHAQATALASESAAGSDRR